MKGKDLNLFSFFFFSHLALLLRATLGYCQQQDKKGKNIDLDNSSEPQEEDLEITEPDDQLSSQQAESQTSEQNQEIMVVEQIRIKNPENIIIALHTKTLLNAIAEGEKARQDLIPPRKCSSTPCLPSSPTAHSSHR